MEQIFYGYFENAQETEPAYEPPRDAPCPFCGKPVSSDDVRTHNLIHGDRTYAQRGYFYRTHRTCAEKFGSLSMDGFILDMIARNGD
jgi:hypothetical protein